MGDFPISPKDNYNKLIEEIVSNAFDRPVRHTPFKISVDSYRPINFTSAEKAFLPAESRETDLKYEEEFSYEEFRQAIGQ